MGKGKRKNRNRFRRGQQGFSFIELMIVVAIVAIIAGIATPQIIAMRDRYKLRSSATDVLSALKRAQSEAVRSDSRVVFTVAGDTYSAFVDDGAGGGVANDGVRNGTETIVYTITANPGNTLASSFATTTYSRRGAPSTTGNITVSQAGSNVQYRITLTTAGHVTLTVSTDGGANFH